MATVLDVNTAHFTNTSVEVDSLLGIGPGWNYLTTPFVTNTLTYTFDTTGVPSQGAGLTAFNASQQAAAAAILTYVSSVTGINFVAVASGGQADLHFAATDLAPAFVSGFTETSWSYTATNLTDSGTLLSYSAEAYIYLDNAEFSAINTSLSAGSEGYQNLLHEIGHALGLQHPFDGPTLLPEAQDNTNNTVMSYTNVGAFKSTFQAYDLLALQWIYGNDGLGGTYGLNSSVGPTLADITAPTVITFSPADEAIGFAVATNIVLTFSEAIARGSGNILLKTSVGTVIESFNAATDTTHLTLAGNTLSVDPTANLAYNTGYKVEFTNTNLIDLAGNFYAGTTNYNFTTAAGDIYVGTPGDDIFTTGAGNDTLSGGAGNDTLIAGSGNDRLDGGIGNDSLNGGFGADTMLGGIGDDQFQVDNLGDVVTENAGEGRDLIFAEISLVLPDNVEDLLLQPNKIAALNGTGNGLVNLINGNELANFLSGLGGNDTLFGNDGNDTLDGGSGNDQLFGGLGIDTASYASATSGITVILGNLFAQNTIGSGQDTLSQIENLTGSAFNDLLSGDSGNNRLDGGSGVDTVTYAAVASTYTVTRNGLTTTVTGPDGTDTLTGIEKLQFGDGTIRNLVSRTIDTNSDGKSDILWRNTDGTAVVWEMDGTQILAGGAANLGVVPTSYSIVDAHGDYNGDGKSDILWRNTDGTLAMWEMNGTQILAGGAASFGVVPTNYSIVDAHGDYNGDGKSDILWRSTDGTLAMWEMNGTQILAGGAASLGVVPTSYSIVDSHGDYNGDGKSDILWRSTDGTLAMWEMDGTQILAGGAAAFGVVPTSYSIVDAHGDYNGDGKSDILWRSTDGTLAMWEMNGTQILAGGAASLGVVPTSYSIVDAHGDYNGDGKSDILWRNTDGTLAMWEMDGTQILAGGAAAFGVVPTSYSIVDAHSDYNGDGKSDILWRNTDGTLALWEMNGTQILAGGAVSFGVVPTSYSITTELGAAINGDNGANTLSGTVARDTLTGNGGSDTLTGGAGTDTFDFNAVADSTLATPDVITDFKHGIDKIDLTDIDASTGTPLDQAFAFGGNNAGTVANSVTWIESAGNTILNFDNTGDAAADMQITLIGVNLGLVATDFFL